MSAALTIRPARANDVASLASLMTQLGYPIEPEELARRFAIVVGGERDALLVAARDERVVGAIDARAIPLLHADGVLGRIATLVVDERERGRGVGRALVAAAEATLVALGCRRIEVTSGDHRSGAHAFYETLGFERRSQRFLKTIDGTHDAPAR